MADTKKVPKLSPGKRPAAESVRGNIFTGSSLYPPAQLKPNTTGLPDQLKEGAETLSGISLDDVMVHYNSSKPAQLNALAYAQGTDIHVGAGQEKHLPHEAWHVVQQKQGRVKPTMKLDGVPVNDNKSLESEADQMGLKATTLATNNKPATQLKSTQPNSQKVTAQTVLQRKVALNTPLSLANLKGLRVSDGGALGVVYIPSVVAKYEINAQAAVDTSESINTMLSGTNDQGWSVGAPNARIATNAEANAIAQKLAAVDQAKSGSAGDPTRVANMVNQIQTYPNNIVIYEKAAGKDFVKHLAKGPESNDDKKAQKQKFSDKLKKGRGLEQLATPAYARQLGRVAAIDIFMGNRDRLHGTGNFENWMSDAKSKAIMLIDNEVSTTSLGQWVQDQDVDDLARKNYPNLAASLTTEVGNLLFHAGYGGGKLTLQEQTIWTNSIRQKFEANLTQGLADGRFHIMNKGWSLAAKFHASHSPLAGPFEERLNHFHANE